MAAAIQVQNLTKTYGSKTALEGLSLIIEPGQIFGFLGENGAGKTTTIKLLLGLIHPSAGEIQLFGCSLTRHRSQLMRRVGALVEAPSYYGHLTARQNLRILALMRGLPEATIGKALDTVGLGEVLDVKVNTFSHGMCQRLGIAMAILGEPELVILDEPTNGLDPSGIRSIRQLIKRLPEQFGTTVLVSSHLLVEVEQVATQIGILKQGALIFEGTLNRLREQVASFVQIQTQNPHLAAEILGSNGFEFNLEDGLVKVKASASEVDTLTRLMIAGDIPIQGIRAEAPHLEDLYFKLMGKDLP